MRKEIYLAIGLALLCGAAVLAGHFLEWSPLLLGLVIVAVVSADCWLLGLIHWRKKPPNP